MAKEPRGVLCPRCKVNRYSPLNENRLQNDPFPPAISRRDNKTAICSNCGLEEAMLDYQRGANKTMFDRKEDMEVKNT